MPTTLLLQFDAGQSWTSYHGGLWLSYAAGVYYTNFEGTYTGDTDLFINAPTAYIIDVGNVFFNGMPLDIVASTTELLSGSGFYFTGSTLYIALPDRENVAYYNIVIGASINARLGGTRKNYNNISFRDEIISAPTVKYGRDRLFFGLLSFDTASIGINNADGRYDLFNDLDVYNQQIRLYFGDQGGIFDNLTGGDFARVATLSIQDFDIGHQIIIRGSDQRKQLSTPLPTNTINSTDYPSAGDDVLGEPVPLAYGACNNIKPVFVTDTRDYDPGIDNTFTILLADTEYRTVTTLDGLRVSGITITTSTSDDIYYSNFSGTNGTVDLTVKANTPIDFDQVRTDITMSGATKAGAILYDLLTNYTEISTSLIDSDMELIGEDCYIYERDQTSLIKIAEKLMNSIRAFFIVDGAGNYLIKERDLTATPLVTLDKSKIVNLDGLQAKRESSEFASRVRVRFDNGKMATDATDEDDAIRRYRKSAAQTFDTQLVNRTDAEAYAGETLLETREIVPTFDITTDILSCMYEKADTATIHLLSIGDIIEVDLVRLSSDWLGRQRCEVESVAYRFDRLEARLSVRYISEDVYI
jgi:hypothetical protein